jgi:hypothetical protein
MEWVVWVGTGRSCTWDCSDQRGRGAQWKHKLQELHTGTHLSKAAPKTRVVQTLLTSCSHHAPYDNGEGDRQAQWCRVAQAPPPRAHTQKSARKYAS